MGGTGEIMWIAGVDEAGRGSLAGPVIAAAVILDPKNPIKGLADSKQLTEARREAFFAVICERAVAFGIGRAEVQEIDQINILQAALLAMQRAIMALGCAPVKVWVDGNCCPVLEYPTEAVIGGDALLPVISAASIVAKVTRDREMVALDKRYPNYGFAKHKGYPTQYHRLMLEKWGPCAMHRLSFAPVKSVFLEK